MTSCTPLTTRAMPSVISLVWPLAADPHRELSMKLAEMGPSKTPMNTAGTEERGARQTKRHTGAGQSEGMAQVEEAGLTGFSKEPFVLNLDGNDAKKQDKGAYPSVVSVLYLVRPNQRPNVMTKAYLEQTRRRSAR